MKKYLIKTILCSSLLSFATAESLKDVVLTAVDKNPDILAEKFNKEAFRLYIDEEKGDYYPTLNFQGFLEDSTTRLDRDNQPNDPSKGSKDGWNMQFSFEQVLYDGGQTPAEVELMKHEYYANRFRSETRIEEIVRAISDDYITLVRLQEIMNFSENHLKIHDGYLKTALDKEEISGEILESYQVNSKKHFIINSIHQQQIDKTEAKNRLETTINQSLTGNICKPYIDESIIPDDINKYIEYSVKNDLRILKVVEDIKKQRENINIANANYLPRIAFQWQLTFDDDLAQPENGRQDINRLRLIMNWNLFEGGKTKIVKQREKLFLLEQQKILDNITQEVIRDAKNSYTNYFIMKDKILNYAKYLDDNLNIKNVYIKQLDAGTRTFIDVLNAESEYFRSRNDYINMKFEQYNYYFDILQNMNKLSDYVISMDKQICSKFVGEILEKKPIIKEDKPIDNDLLMLLGDESAVNNEQSGMEVDQLLNGEDTQINVDENKSTVSNTLPKNKYTINLGFLDSIDNLNTFISKNKLDKEKVFAYHTNPKTVVLYGDFKTAKDATKVVNNLSNRLISKKVYIDSVKKHETMLIKFKSLNTQK